MSIWDNAVVVGTLGVLFGAASAYVQGALAARAKSSEELRDRRLKAYPELWKATATLSEYPKAIVTWEDLLTLHCFCRSWYFTTGGLYLSESSRARYGDFQDLLGHQLEANREEDQTAQVPNQDYDDLARVCSAARTALAQDLETRQQRSLIWAVTKRQWHRRMGNEAEQLITAAGKQRLRVPLRELQLEPPHSVGDLDPGARAETDGHLPRATPEPPRPAP